VRNIAMLEIKDLYKVYKPKNGTPVVALNHISLTFPETGLIFILGKSGIRQIDLAQRDGRSRQG
jgi:ABC-type sugar transport system ATPase subunit